MIAYHARIQLMQIFFNYTFIQFAHKFVYKFTCMSKLQLIINASDVNTRQKLCCLR